MGYCPECMNRIIEKNKQLEYNCNEYNKTQNIYTLALCIAGGIVGVLSAYKAGEFDYAWYWNIITFILYTFGGALALGGVSIISAVVIHYLINTIKDMFKSNK